MPTTHGTQVPVASTTPYPASHTHLPLCTAKPLLHAHCDASVAPTAAVVASESTESQLVHVSSELVALKLPTAQRVHVLLCAS
jgi:hypothetical protein